MWTHRILLEAAQYEENAFVTLTYSDEHVPDGNTLSPKHTQDWLKRLRKLLVPHKIRFYLVGEYGDEKDRPHYHAILFGYPACPYVLQNQQRPNRQCTCSSCAPLYTSWGKGRVYVGTVESDSAQYVVGYTLKKMTTRDDARLHGRHPEFSRQSNRPGIGFAAMHELASELMRLNLDTSQPDVPSVLRHGKKLLPLGRYLVRNLRKMVGKDEKTPQAILTLLKEELHDVRSYAFDNSLNLAEVIKDRSKNKLLQIETRQKIFKGRKTL